MWVAWIRHQRWSTAALAEQPFDRARAGPGEAVLDLLHLLGDVDVDRAVRRQRGNRRRVRPASRRAGCAARRRRRRRFKRANALRGSSRAAARSRFDIVDEAALALVRRRAAEGGMGVEDRQQRQADAGVARPRRRCARPSRRCWRRGCRRGRGADSGTRRRAKSRPPASRHRAGRRPPRPGRASSTARSGTSPRASSRSCRRRGRAASARPAMPRWKAWLCRLGMPGSENRVALVAGLRRGARLRRRRCGRPSSVIRTSPCQPSGSSACSAKIAVTGPLQFSMRRCDDTTCVAFQYVYT